MNDPSAHVLQINPEPRAPALYAKRQGSARAMSARTIKPRASSGDFWDDVWKHQPSEERDDALLARERRGPRWSEVRTELISAFGTLAGLRTIELGSGRGDLSALLAQHGAHVTLLDANRRALDQARRRFDRLGLKAIYHHRNFLDFPPSKGAVFDVALSSGVIEHFRGADRTRVVQAHREVLRPGGLAVISVPHARCPSYRLWKAYCETRHCWPYGLEIPYGRRELVRRAWHAGLIPSRIIGIGFWQSVGDHLLRPLLGRGPDWIHRRSVMDAFLGSTVVLFARRPE
jgi:SAM-dependent methyltransferase